MSIRAIDWAFGTKIENPGAKFVLVALANYANAENFSYPSVKKIEEITGVKARTIAEHLKFLEDASFIKRHPRFLKNGGRASTLYEICISPQPPMPPGQEAPDEGADLSYPSLEPEDTFEETSKVDPAPSPEKPKKETTMFDDLTPILEEEGNDYAGAKKMLGSLLSRYGRFFVFAIYEENKELILNAESPFPYLKKILIEKKNTTPAERAAEKSLREAMSWHVQLHQNLEYTPPFEAKNYLGRFPLIAQFVGQEKNARLH